MASITTGTAVLTETPDNKGRRPRLLDLGCGAGGASAGYDRAGFDVTGIDIVPQPRYPFRFIQADMLDYSFTGYDAIHISAPCQKWSKATLGQRCRGRQYPDLITPMRRRLSQFNIPWVMENVSEAPLRPDLDLCGCMFGLELPGIGQLQRLRRFEFSWKPVIEPIAHCHTAPAISICGHGTPAWQRRRTGHIGVAHWREIMRIDWMRREELTEAIPPAYTEYVGKLLMAAF
jgi:DNA (cytosine-5)-methyltransferase 1